MLADTKRKLIYSTDPRGSAWSQDENKYGQKLLEKMGWVNGKGLGVKEDGQCKNVSLSVKNNNRGLGCSKSYADTWIAHQDDFNSVLASLADNHSQTNDNSDSNKFISLEEKSKSSKKRVHYQKFTKSKDLTNYGNKDLDCILGRKITNDCDQDDVLQKPDNTLTESASESFQTIVSSCNMQDYFAKIMSTKRKSDIKPTDIGTSSNSDSDSDMNVSEPKKRKHHGNIENESEKLITNNKIYDSEICPLEAKKSIKKSKKKKPSKDKEESFQLTPENQEDTCLSTCKRKKDSKRKKNKKGEKTLCAASDRSFCEENSQIMSSREEKFIKKVKSKRKGKKLPAVNDKSDSSSETNDHLESNSNNVDINNTLNISEVTEYKKTNNESKFKQDTFACESENTQDLDESKVAIADSIKTTIKRKKRKKNKKIKPNTSLTTNMKSFQGANVSDIKGYARNFKVNGFL